MDSLSLVLIVWFKSFSSRNVAKMNKSDFNTLFSTLDTDGNGSVSFMDFCADMGKCYGDFGAMKGEQANDGGPR